MVQLHNALMVQFRTSISNLRKAKSKGEKIMARKPMVTRTITTTKVTALCLNVNTCECSNEAIVLPRTYSDDKKLLDLVRASFDTAETKVVSIVAKEEIETLYGMEEADFIKSATILNPTTRKAEATEEAPADNQ